MVFNTVPSKMVHVRGEKDVLINTTGGEKKHVTAVLSVTILSYHVHFSRVSMNLKTPCCPKDGCYR